MSYVCKQYRTHFCILNNLHKWYYVYLLVLIRLHSAISNQKTLYQALNDCYLSHITRKLGKGGSVVIKWLSHVIRDDRDIIYHPVALC